MKELKRVSDSALTLVLDKFGRGSAVCTVKLCHLYFSRS